MLNPFTIALLAAVAGVANARCNRDNCLRAVIASAFPTRSGSADCASYFQTTVTPATVTHYATLTQTESTTTSGTAFEVTTTTEVEPFTVVVATTITAVETDIVGFVKRQEPEKCSEIPAYASACSGVVRYSSACSCVGATGSTIFAAAPTTTITVTVIDHATFTYSTTTTSTAFETDRITVSVPTTTTTTTTTTSTRPPFQTCTGGAYNALGVGGCGPDCYCDQAVRLLEVGFCNSAHSCGQACSTELDCPEYSACSSNHPECNGGGVCLDFSLCLSADVNLPVPKKLAMRGDAKYKRDGSLKRPTN